MGKLSTLCIKFDASTSDEIQMVADRLGKSDLYMVQHWIENALDADEHIIKHRKELGKVDVFVKQKGAKLIAKCPFHKEETPSLLIYLDLRSYHCLGCGKTGSSNELTVKYLE